jgi:hypothetical protein
MKGAMSEYNNTDINIVKLQTNITDEEVIAACLQKNNNDIIKTIMELSSLQEIIREKVVDPVFEEIRNIVEEKEKLYHDLCKHT